MSILFPLHHDWKLAEVDPNLLSTLMMDGLPRTATSLSSSLTDRRGPMVHAHVLAHTVAESGFGDALLPTSVVHFGSESVPLGAGCGLVLGKPSSLHDA